MKILHTSDWHLGQSFFTKSRKNEHAAFLRWLLNEVEEKRVDALIVAGDVFDTGTPPSYARELYHEFIGELQDKQCTLVVLGGNHDSVSVLNESKALLKYLNSHVVASTNIDDSEQVFALKDKSGNQAAILCAVPFIRPRDVVTSEAGQSATDKRQNLGNAIKQHYASLYQQACALRDSINPNIPIIATGHLTALGVSQSESVRDIYIGTLEGFDAAGFPPADYIALGHIHRPQKVAGKEHIRYCGSPIPLSFDELNTQKQVVLVDFNSEEISSASTPSITPIAVPRFQAMAVIKGDLPAIEHAINHRVEIEKATSDNPVWLCIEVETQDYLTDLQQRVQALLEDKHAEILQLKRVRKRQQSSLSQKENIQLSELSVAEVFAARMALENIEEESEYTDQEAGPPNDRKARIEQLFAEALELVQGNSEDMKSEELVSSKQQDKGEEL